MKRKNKPIDLDWACFFLVSFRSKYKIPIFIPGNGNANGINELVKMKSFSNCFVLVLVCVVVFKFYEPIFYNTMKIVGDRPVIIIIIFWPNNA